MGGGLAAGDPGPVLPHASPANRWSISNRIIANISGAVRDNVIRED